MMKGMQLLFCHIVSTEASAPRLFVNSRRINSPCHYALRESFDKSFVEKWARISLVVTLRYVDPTIGASDEEYSSTPRIYGSTLSCPFSHRLYHRHHPATGQSGILFSKLPRLNQRIALNGALLVIPPFLPPCRPFPPVHAWIIHILDSILQGGPSLWKSVRNTGPDYNSVHRATRGENSEPLLPD